MRERARVEELRRWWLGRTRRETPVSARSPLSSRPRIRRRRARGQDVVVVHKGAQNDLLSYHHSLTFLPKSAVLAATTGA